MLEAITLIAHWIALGHDAFRESIAGRMHLRGAFDSKCERVGMLEEQLELLQARFERLDPMKRPHYKYHERLRILIFGQRYSLSQVKLARAFGVTIATISNWKRDLENGAEELVRAKAPVNKLPDLIREVVFLIKRDFPAWGSRTIAGVLARMGLKGSRTSVRRILRKGPPKKRPDRKRSYTGWIKARCPNRVWVIDWTTTKSFFREVVIGAVIDSFSRKVLAIRAFTITPTHMDAILLMREAIRTAHAKPDWIITDRGTQFRTKFRRAMRRLGIKPRYSRVGEPNLSRLDRFWKTFKSEYAKGLLLYRSSRSITADLKRYIAWYNTHRPHSSLYLQTPHERYAKRREKRRRAPTAGKLVRDNYRRDRRLPVFTFTRAA